MLSFSDFAKVFAAYEQYVQQVPAQPIQQVPQVPAQPIPAVAPQVQQVPAQPIQQVPQVPAQPIQQVPQVPQVPAVAPQVAQPILAVDPMAAVNQRLAALEARAPMPTMDTPKPVTVDDIILGIIGDTRKE